MKFNGLRTELESIKEAALVVIVILLLVGMFI